VEKIGKSGVVAARRNETENRGRRPRGHPERLHPGKLCPGLPEPGMQRKLSGGGRPELRKRLSGRRGDQQQRLRHRGPRRRLFRRQGGGRRRRRHAAEQERARHAVEKEKPELEAPSRTGNHVSNRVVVQTERRDASQQVVVVNQPEVAARTGNGERGPGRGPANPHEHDIGAAAGLPPKLHPVEKSERRPRRDGLPPTASPPASASAPSSSPSKTAGAAPSPLRPRPASRTGAAPPAPPAPSQAGRDASLRILSKCHDETRIEGRNRRSGSAVDGVGRLRRHPEASAATVASRSPPPNEVLPRLRPLWISEVLQPAPTGPRGPPRVVPRAGSSPHEIWQQP